MSEFELAIEMARRALNVPYADPDDDLRTISRQFLRLAKRENHCETCGAEDHATYEHSNEVQP
jgi:hypothetical protein